ncbi:uncharacterized protein LOC122318058 [Carya illinoinensis]|uniref:Uncharacterized protein n=1 Tax=Carya illinoinensis TaxID=32201 RepID=A0A8T1PZU7_CARIL|nr:uncharacterized protein LOC122318058 [Carya illinoinensis]KAG6645800.1 hypothetical protein CIPAW_08G148100 [Carya illinoinensis]KAG6701115.1 hypothetical protein I3842_08G149100 [Carya illinoinensis]
MENMRKDQEHDTNVLLNEYEHEQTKEDQSQPNVALATKTESPLQDNAHSQNQQHSPVLQWPYTAQHAVEQSPLVSKPCPTTQSSSPIIQNQWQQLLNLQQNPTSHQAHQGQPMHFVQPASPFWLPQHPAYLLPGVNAPCTFSPLTPLGTTDVSWQAPGALGGGTPSTNQPHIPNCCYQVGYAYQGFPGPWDHSSWSGQGQQSQPPCTYSFPGAYGFFPLPTPQLSNHAASLGQPFQRGFIRLPTNLSQKHQQLWDSQSAENVQLWNVINLLQSEIADYKNRLMKLEVAVSSQKPTVEEPTSQVTGSGSARQPLKRGRPKKKLMNALTSPSESNHRAQCTKLPSFRAPSGSKSIIFEKVILRKAEDKEKVPCVSVITEQENIEKVSNIVSPHTIGNSGINGNNQMMPAFQNHVHREFSGVQISGFGLSSSSELKSIDEKVKDLKTDHSILSQQAKGMNNNGASPIYMGATANGSLGFHSYITPDYSGRNLLNIGSQGVHNDCNVTSQEGKIIPGWGFANDEDASEELETAVVGSTKDENEGEMGDDVSSGAEDDVREQDEPTYKMDDSAGIGLTLSKS